MKKAPKPLAILESAERHIAQAEEDLKTLKNMGLDPNLEQRVAPVIRKYAEVAEQIRAKKLQALNILAQLRFYMGGTMVYRDVPSPHTQLKITFLGRGDLLIDVERVNYFTPAGFAAQRHLHFFPFCNLMLREIEAYLRDSPAEHAEDIAALRTLIDEMTARLR